MITEVPEVLFTVAVVPFIIMLVNVVKGLGLNSKFAPLVAIALGLAFGVGYSLYSGDVDIVTGIVWGIIYGASAIGAYSGVKNVKEGLGGGL